MASKLAWETREVAAARGAWQQHLVDGLQQLFNAQVAFVPEVETQPDGKFVLRSVYKAGVIDDSDFRTLIAHLDDPDAQDPVIQKMVPLKNAIACARREDLVPDDEWYSGKHFNEYRSPAKLDPVMFGFAPSSHSNWFVGMGVHRSADDRAFDQSGPALFRVLCEGVAELCRTIGPRSNPLDGVPQKRRSVLERLLAGDSERQAALALGMTEHAVHAHVKSLHKQFSVCSRGELLARFIEPGSR